MIVGIHYGISRECNGAAWVGKDNKEQIRVSVMTNRPRLYSTH